MNDERVSLGGGGFTLLRDWNETWYLCSYQCWYFDVDRKWPTVEVMVYIKILLENMFIFLRSTEQTLIIFGRNFPNEVWHNSHMTSDILMVNIWRMFSQQYPKGFEWILQYMHLLIRGHFRSTSKYQHWYEHTYQVSFQSLNRVNPPPPRETLSSFMFVDQSWHKQTKYHHMYRNS
jgi:hypothetical protein